MWDENSRQSRNRIARYLVVFLVGRPAYSVVTIWLWQLLSSGCVIVDCVSQDEELPGEGVMYVLVLYLNVQYATPCCLLEAVRPCRQKGDIETMPRVMSWWGRLCKWYRRRHCWPVRTSLAFPTHSLSQLNLNLTFPNKLIWSSAGWTVVFFCCEDFLALVVETCFLVFTTVVFTLFGRTGHWGMLGLQKLYDCSGYRKGLSGLYIFVIKVPRPVGLFYK